MMWRKMKRKESSLKSIGNVAVAAEEPGPRQWEDTAGTCSAMALWNKLMGLLANLHEIIVNSIINPLRKAGKVRIVK